MKLALRLRGVTIPMDFKKAIALQCIVVCFQIIVFYLVIFSKSNITVLQHSIEEEMPDLSQPQPDDCFAESKPQEVENEQERRPWCVIPNVEKQEASLQHLLFLKRNKTVLDKKHYTLRFPSPYIPTWKELEAMSLQNSILRGQWKPPKCQSLDTVAIIVPYRNRDRQLRTFLWHMHKFMQSQLLHYSIFVVEQAPGTRFNRAALFNIGFLESQRAGHFCCVIFNDVDLLPMDKRNIHRCGDAPRHLSAAIDIFNYKLPYEEIFGGAVAITRDQFRKLNGFSNLFYGWGGEDDDLGNRIALLGPDFKRYPIEVARYVMLRHEKFKANTPNSLRHYLLYGSAERQKIDGLNSIHYKLLKPAGYTGKSEFNSVRWIRVALPEEETLALWGLDSPFNYKMKTMLKQLGYFRLLISFLLVISITFCNFQILKQLIIHFS